MAAEARERRVAEETSERRRLPREERRAAMLDDAVPFFAEKGFAATTRELADHLGVTQALIYKHFASKDAFIAEMMERAFAAGRLDESGVLGGDGPLAERLAAYYRGFAGSADRFRLKLFLRAGLEGWPLPGQRGARLTGRVFAPVIAALRREAGLPDLDARPMMRGEREAAMMLHASIVFLGIREHVYRMPMPEDRDDIVALYAAVFVPGALDALRRLHADPGEASGFTVPQLTGS